MPVDTSDSNVVTILWYIREGAASYVPAHNRAFFLSLLRQAGNGSRLTEAQRKCLVQTWDRVFLRIERSIFDGIAGSVVSLLSNLSSDEAWEYLAK